LEALFVFDTLRVGVYNAQQLSGAYVASSGVEDCMDSVMTQLARELADAVSASVANDPRVEACREKARAAGFDMRVSLEAVVAFASRDAAGVVKGSAGKRAAGRSGFEMSANDRRFLKSLRISADEPTEKEVE
jgi:hypothetical protein